MLYFDLLVSFMRVMLMLETIDEKQVMVAMYVAANNWVNPSSTTTNMSYTSKYVSVALLSYFANVPFLE